MDVVKVVSPRLRGRGESSIKLGRVRLHDDLLASTSTQEPEVVAFAVMRESWRRNEGWVQGFEEVFPEDDSMKMRWALGAALLAPMVVSAEESESRRERRFEFTYVAGIDVPEGTKRLDLWLPYPSTDQNQDIEVLGISAPFPTEIRKDSEHGNSIVYMRADNPGGPPSIRQAFGFFFAGSRVAGLTTYA